MTVIIGLVVGVGVLLAVITGAFAFVPSENGFNPVQGASIGLAVITLIFIIAVVVLGLVYQAGLINTVDRVRTKAGFGQVFTKSLGVIFPLFVMGLLEAYIIMGGFFLFVIPAFIFAFFLVFLHYEVVLGKEHYMGAMKESIRLVRSNTSDVFIRLLVLFGINMGILMLYYMIVIPVSIVFGVGSAMTDNNMSMVFVPLQILFNFFTGVIQAVWGWFNLIFLYTLYRQAKDAEKPSAAVSTMWFWVVSSIGWIVGIIMMVLFGVAIAAIVAASMNQSQKDKEKKVDMQYDVEQEFDYQQVLPSGTTIEESEVMYQYAVPTVVLPSGTTN